MENNWEKPYEDNGVTLGPEDALRRETEKTKTLKVEKLQLKDTLKKLKAENDALAKTNQVLEQKLNSLTGQSSGNIYSKTVQNSTTLHSDQNHTMRWSYFLLIFNLTALAIFLVFLLNQ